MLRFLIVDDKEQDRYFLQVLLGKAGYAVDSAENGEEALKKARENPPDMIVSDILMPVMDGFTLCREWRKDEALRDIPFVFYTATYTDPRDEEFAIKLGADRFITKPVEPDALMTALKELLQHPGRKDEGEAPGQAQADESYFKSYSEVLVRKLEEKLELFRLVFNTDAAVIFIITAAGTILEINRAARELLGIEGENSLDKDFAEQFVPERQRNDFRRVMAEALDGASLRDYECGLIGADGAVHTILWNIDRLMRSSGGISDVVAIGRDMTHERETERERNKAEEALQTSKLQLSEAMDLAHIVYWEGDPVSRLLILNDPFYTFYGTTAQDEGGYKIAVDDYVNRFIHPDDKTSYYRATERISVANGHEFAVDLEHRIVRQDGEVRHVLSRLRGNRDDAGNIIRIYGTNQDITDRKQAEEERGRLATQLFQSQKMESMGTLAGGIAHDFNNIITALVGYASLLDVKMEEEDPLRIYIDQIMSASRKASDLTQSLLAFSRQRPVNLAPLSINSIIKGTQKLLKSLVTEDIALKVTLTKEDLAIMADATQIDQILFNLTVNAKDAMPNGGTITIETKPVELSEEFRRVHLQSKQGKYVLFSISDTGTGMDEATKERIFDPFFTTKEVGKGTGLGLSTVYGIVKQHNGYIDVESRSGEGTTFCIYFPVVDKVVEEEKPVSKPIKGGKETILIAEDNEAVRNLIRTVLVEYGYKVIEAIDGADAVEQFNKANGKVDLLILDSVMPQKNGREAYNEIRRSKKSIKVLFTSGYTKDVYLDKGIEDSEFDFIAKPVSPNKLLQKVREVLDK